MIAVQLVKGERATRAEVAPNVTEVRFSRSENSTIVWCEKNQIRIIPNNECQHYELERFLYQISGCTVTSY